MDNTDSLAQVGLGFTCDFTKPGGFVGQDAVVKEKELGAAALPRRLVQVLVTDPAPLLHHGEVLYRDGVVVGDVRAGSYGHTLGGAVGLAMVEATPVLGDGPTAKMTPKSFRESTWEVDIAGTRYPATVSLRPLYDPKNERIKS
jgi:4-methylaminobutanoate oxidase (formaldehyde-forming)|tara:strand:- start:1013 stop:1444 length:432 start_codon:yes stop_codon:yes gene_type:complete